MVSSPTIFAAFAAGLISFVSPCVLPLVPGYLSAVSGAGVSELRAGAGRQRRVMGAAALFCASFSLMFILLGLGSTALGSVLRQHQDLLARVSGIVLIVLGLVWAGAPMIPVLNRELRPRGLLARVGVGSPILAGLAFAIAWTPCVGPTLGAILTLAAGGSGFGQGGFLLACYALGLAVPFLLCAAAFDRSMGVFRWIRDRYVIITTVGGVLLIVMGVLILTGEFTRLNTEAQDLLQRLGVDFYSV